MSKAMSVQASVQILEVLSVELLEIRRKRETGCKLVQHIYIDIDYMPQQMANWYADKRAKAYLKKMRSKREFVSARPVVIEKGARWRLYHKGPLWLVQSPSELKKSRSTTWCSVTFAPRHGRALEDWERQAIEEGTFRHAQGIQRLPRGDVNAANTVLHRILSRTVGMPD
jgi:hypothetical protein